MIDTIKRLVELIASSFWTDREPRWKRHPELYYRCPECDDIAVNARWKLRDEVQVEENRRFSDLEDVGNAESSEDEVLAEYNGHKIHRRELQFQCPNCEEWVPMEDVHSLDEIAYFEQKASN